MRTGTKNSIRKAVRLSSAALLAGAFFSTAALADGIRGQYYPFEPPVTPEGTAMDYSRAQLGEAPAGEEFSTKALVGQYWPGDAPVVYMDEEAGEARARMGEFEDISDISYDHRGQYYPTSGPILSE